MKPDEGAGRPEVRALRPPLAGAADDPAAVTAALNVATPLPVGLLPRHARQAHGHG
nr:hypothetical protein OH826_36035 [Streptomyces sp. NBC_00899]